MAHYLDSVETVFHRDVPRFPQLVFPRLFHHISGWHTPADIKRGTVPTSQVRWRIWGIYAKNTTVFITLIYPVEGGQAMKDNQHRIANKKLMLSAISKFAIGISILGAFLFLCGGDLRYWNAWLYLGVFALSIFFFGVYLYTTDKELLQKRLNTTMWFLFIDRLTKRW